MLQALLEPVEACAVATVPVPVSANYRPSGAPPDEHVLRILRGVPEVECLLGGVVASWHSSLGSLHSRRWHRVTYDKPILITPLNDLTERPSQKAFLVQAHDLSLSGLSFCHPLPLASRKVIVQFRAEGQTAADQGAEEGILAILRWCRFRRDGSYQSGGQFLRAAVIEQTARGLWKADDLCDSANGDQSSAIEWTPAF
jgi:hypothetical protein